MRRIIVVGAGASGMMAAIWAARAGAQVTLLEGMEKPGKKLLATGNGRCNLTNLKGNDIGAYHGGNKDTIQQVLHQFSVEDTLSFFHEIGVLTRDRNGYIYPYTDQAQAVVELLLLELKRQKVKVKCSEKIIGATFENNQWMVSTKTWKYQSDALILSTGSKAAPVTGSDGSGYQLAEQLGHRICTPMQALVPLYVKNRETALLAGVRSQVSLTLFVEKKECQREEGELQWTEKGISGIVVFQLSHLAVQALSSRKKVEVQIDFFPEYTKEELYEMLQGRWKKQKEHHPEELLLGLTCRKVIPYLWKKSGAALKKDFVITEESLQNLVREMKGCRVEIIGCDGFEHAQVCQGGIDLNEVSPNTLESLCIPELYLTGELLDVDAICGGFNLQWAWSSGFVAGNASAKEKL